MSSVGSAPAAEKYDVVVVGGGSGGVGAAVGAAQAGASVHLIERYPFLGGAATASSVLSYCGFFDQRRELVVGGVGGDLLARLRAGGAYQEITFKWSGNTVVMIDPEFTKLTLDRMVADAGVSLSLHSYLVERRVGRWACPCCRRGNRRRHSDGRRHHVRRRQR